MTPAMIKYKLALRNITQTSIAQKLGITVMPVCKEINGKATSERIRRAIAEAIEKKPEKVFPEYYSNPKKRKRKAA